MFREMRRNRQLLTTEEAIEVLGRGTAGTLALVGDDGYAYSLPISYVYNNGKLYFHSAVTGHKIDAIKKHDKVSFSVIDKDEIVQKEYTTYFRSVIAFGKIRVIEDKNEKMDALLILAAKYSPDFKDGINKYVKKELDNVAVIELEIEYLTGKEAIELVKAKEDN